MMKNNILTGIGIGLIAPLLAFLATRYLELPPVLTAKPLSVYVIAAVLNLLLVRYFYRIGQDRSGQGVVLITFLGALVLIFSGNVQI